MNTQAGQQAFRELISYSQKSANNVDFSAYASSSRRSYSSEPLHSHSHHPHVPSQAHRTYNHISGFSQNAYSHHHSSHPMQPDAHRYSEASHDEDDRLSYEYHVDDPHVGSHPHSSSHDRVYSMHRYPSSSETSRYPSDHDTLPPLNVEFHHHSQQHPSRAPLGQYRSTLRGYHALQSGSLQNISQDDHGHGSLPARAAYAYSQLETMSYTSPRRISDTSDISQHSHLDTHPDDARNSDDAVRKPPSFLTVDQASSIPMSNNPSRHFHHGNDPQQDYEYSQQDLRHGEHTHTHTHTHTHYSHTDRLHTGHHHRSRHANVVTSSAATPTLSHSHFNPNPTGRRNSSELILPSISHPLNLQHSDPPRSRSTPDPYTPSQDHYSGPSSSYRISSYPRQTRAPLLISDHEYGFGSKLGAGVSSRSKPEFDRRMDPPPRFNVPGQEDDQMLLRTKIARTGSGPSAEVGIAGRHNSDPALVPEKPPPMSAGTAKKKKKSKMHECEICHKKFPRPSGLKTHMNTHSNERPFPCGFPGCTRTFGVRSNARRHMRTHGVIPAPAPAPVPEEPPYVVGFDTPTILVPQHTTRAVQSSELYRVGASSKGFDERSQSSSVHQQGFREEQPTSSTRVPAFKVRWMPLSLDTQPDPMELRAGDDAAHTAQGRDQDQDNLRTGKERWQGEDMGKYHNEDEESAQSQPRLRLEMDNEREDKNEGDIYSDRAVLPRLSLPLGPNASNSQHSPSSFVASRSSAEGVSTSGSSMLISSIIDHDATASQFSLSSRPTMSSLHSQSSSSFGPSRSAVEVCRCSPPCPGDSSGIINCHVLGRIYPTSISPSISAHSFATPSPSTSTSPINLPSGYGPVGGYESVNPHSSHNSIQQSASASRYDDRDPYVHDTHPYHSSQVNILSV